MTPTRILVVGGGGREHALAWKLAGEPGVNTIHVAPGSAAIALEPRVQTHPEVAALDARGLVRLARQLAIELAVIGPEAPLAAGVADALRTAGIPTFGPSAAAARIEASKAFCRDVAAAAGVPMAEGRAFSDPAPAVAYARGLAARMDGTAGVVVKADGLAAGKGVTVCAGADEAEAELTAIFGAGAEQAPGSARVVVEERLVGPEASLIALCDGRVAIGLPPARDHKRLLDDDEGPNTGGMGAYSPLPDLSTERATVLLDTVHRRILGELERRGARFVGALYAGMILTADGPRLLECNARFGDPETQVILPRLGLALAPLLLAAARGELGRTAAGLGLLDPIVQTVDRAAVGIVLAAAGYPAAPRRDDAIMGLDTIGDDALVFHSGSVLASDGRFATAGGRVLTIVGRGVDLADARARAEAAADRISFAGLQRRRDIAANLPGASPAPTLAAIG
ncbi:MAG: phosphoribosylamine--glycine ligase [Chloroflexota bacterium]